LCEFGSIIAAASGSELPGKAKRRNSFWAVTPFLSVVTVLTPATTWTEGFTNRLIGPTIAKSFFVGNQRQMKNAGAIFWTTHFVR
jgi:hypothetical protein